MAVQNPAGRRQKTQTDEVLEEIRDALKGLLQPQVSGTTSAAITFQLGAIFMIGDHMRLVALPDGCALEVLNSSDVWVEQVRWTEA